MKSHKKILEIFKVDRQDILIFFPIAILALFLSSLPTLVAAISTPTNFSFAGFYFLHDPWDINVYFSAMRSGREGEFLYQNAYDANPHPKAPIYLLYIFLGHVSQMTHLSIPFIYHLSSVFFGFVFLSTLYLFLSLAFKEKIFRLLSFSLITFGGGLGPLHFSFVESNIFHTLHLPNFLITQLTFILLLAFSVAAGKKHSWHFSLAAFLAGLILIFSHPYMFVVASAVIVVWVIYEYFKYRRLFYLALPHIVILSSTALPFMYFSLFTNPMIVGWQSNASFQTPPPHQLLLAYFPLVILIPFGIFAVAKRRGAFSPLLVSWFFIQLIFFYLPIYFQRFMMRGYFIPLVILSILGLRMVTGKIPNAHKFFIYIFLAIVVSLPTFVSTGFLLTNISTQNPWLYQPKEVLETFDWMDKHLEGKSVILAEEVTSNFIPTQTDLKVYAGHGAHTPSFKEKQKNVRKFFRREFDSFERSIFLKEKGIDYVFLGPEEKEKGNSELNNFNLPLIYENASVKVFSSR